MSHSHRYYSDEFRENLISSIRSYQEFDKLPAVSLDDIITNLNNLIIVAGYKFKHNWGDMELHHDWYRDKTPSWLYEDLNRCMQAEYDFYRIPYITTFRQDQHFCSCEIVEIVGIDRNDELVDVLRI